jgi:hypothetical protein
MYVRYVDAKDHCNFTLGVYKGLIVTMIIIIIIDGPI